jgi:SAM-dependent methyltransferase
MTKNINDWHKSFFNALYWELFMKRSPEQIAQEVNVIEQLVKKNKISSILDVCCGVGEIAAELGNRKGIDSWGIEYSEDYVKSNYLKNIIQGDARVMQTHKTFSLVLNWFSSFTYFNKEDNYKILQNCYNYCDGVFIIETSNALNIINKFSDKIAYEKEFNGINYKVERISNINLEDNTLEQDWIINDGKNTTVHNTRSYLYLPKDIKDSLLDIGFSKVEMFGLEDGQIKDLKFNTKRLLIKATI